MLTGQELFGYLPGALKENIQQQGIDLRVKTIWQVLPYNPMGCQDNPGYIPVTGKTHRPFTDLVETESPEVEGKPRIYHLQPGYYEVEYEEGCDLPDWLGLDIKSRSSLVRCGSLIHSGHFDPGFHTENIGSFLQVVMPLYLDEGARIAQAMGVESHSVNNPYDGQWQGDNQR